jgi:acid phosphatase type 7
MKTLSLFLACTLASFAADSASTGNIVGGPYVVNVTSRTATIAWLVKTAEVTVSGPATKVSPSVHVEKTTLAGLTPNTRYDYSVAGNDPAGKGHFKTPPAAGGPFTFVVYGDNRTRNDVHRRVIETLLKQGTPDFVVQTGDLVADGFDSSLWPVFFDIEHDLLRQTAFFPSLGNHERNTPVFGEYFLKPKPYYSFDWGNAHFAVINSDLPNVSPLASERDAFWAEQTRWLEEDLKAHQGADYRFVAAHHPPMTAVTRRQGDNAHMTALIPMFEKYRVSAGLFGHDHNYQHYLQNGIHYIVSGGGGAPLYDVDKPAPGITQKVASIENFVSVSVDGKTAHVQTFDIGGKVIDDFEIHASAPLN